MKTGLARSIGLWIVLSFYAAFIASCTSRSPNHRCARNLKKVGLACLVYSREDFAFPTNVAQLYPKYLGDLTAFVCPIKGHRPGDGESIAHWTDYFYVSGLHGGDGTGIPLLICPSRNHKNGLSCVFFADGTLDWLSAAESDALLREPWSRATWNSEEELKRFRDRVRVMAPGVNVGDSTGSGPDK